MSNDPNAMDDDDLLNLTTNERIVLTHAVRVANGVSEDYDGDELPITEAETDEAVERLVRLRLMFAEDDGGVGPTTLAPLVVDLMAALADGGA